jgi:NitT/TauT family transport system substrate-binding protein
MQCFATSEPLAAKKAGVEPKTFLVADAGYNPYTTVSGHARQLSSAAHPDVVTEGRDAVREAGRVPRDPTATNAGMNKLNSVDGPRHVRRQRRGPKAADRDVEDQTERLGSMTLSCWQTLANSLTDLRRRDDRAGASKCFVPTSPAPHGHAP